MTHTLSVLLVHVQGLVKVGERGPAVGAVGSGLLTAAGITLGAVDALTPTIPALLYGAAGGVGVAALPVVIWVSGGPSSDSTSSPTPCPLTCACPPCPHHAWQGAGKAAVRAFHNLREEEEPLGWSARHALAFFRQQSSSGGVHVDLNLVSLRARDLVRAALHTVQAVSNATEALEGLWGEEVGGVSFVARLVVDHAHAWLDTHCVHKPASTHTADKRPAHATGLDVANEGPTGLRPGRDGVGYGNSHHCALVGVVVPGRPCRHHRRQRRRHLRAGFGRDQSGSASRVLCSRANAPRQACLRKPVGGGRLTSLTTISHTPARAACRR
jgi:hypothetical protein